MYEPLNIYVLLLNKNKNFKKIVAISHNLIKQQIKRTFTKSSSLIVIRTVSMDIKFRPWRWLIVLFRVLLENISVMLRRHHCRWIFKDAKFMPLLGTYGLWNGGGGTGLRFLRSHPKDCANLAHFTTIKGYRGLILTRFPARMCEWKRIFESSFFL